MGQLNMNRKEWNAAVNRHRAQILRAAAELVDQMAEPQSAEEWGQGTPRRAAARMVSRQLAGMARARRINRGGPRR